MKAAVLVFLAILTASIAAAATARGRLEEAYRLLVGADAALAAGNSEEAARDYRNALAVFEQLPRQYPGWQGAVVEARIAYARNRLARIARGDDAAGMSESVDRAERDSLSEGLDDAELKLLEEIAGLRARNRELRAENMNLKARLRILEAGRAAAAITLPESVSALLARLLIEESARRMEGGEIERALDLLESGALLLPGNPDIDLALGMARCRTGAYAEAERGLRRVVVLQPENAAARLALGAALTGLGRIGMARVELEAALRIDPAYADAHYNMARLLLMLPDGDPLVARRHYLQSVALGGEPDQDVELLIQREALRRIGLGR